MNKIVKAHLKFTYWQLHKVQEMILKLREFIYDKKYVTRRLQNKKKIQPRTYISFRVIRKNIGYTYNLLKKLYS